MTPLETALIHRFGQENVSSYPKKEGGIPLILLDLELKSRTKVLVTNGLSDYLMPVPEKLAGNEYNEIYFCLPSYWDVKDSENPNMNWVFEWIQRIANYVVEKKTWLGNGHTMPCGSEMESLSPSMQQNHFFFSDPVLLENELLPLEIGGKNIHFLAIIPIFGEEMDYKQGKGTFKFQQKLRTHGVTEKLDDYRGSTLKSKWRFLKR
jgi:hypothetical protein